MVQSVKGNLQLFFAAVGLAAVLLVTMGNAPPDHSKAKKISAKVSKIARLTEQKQNSN